MASSFFRHPRGRILQQTYRSNRGNGYPQRPRREACVRDSYCLQFVCIYSQTVYIRIVRGKLNPLIEQWQRICILSERIIKRREAAAVRDTPPPFRPSLSMTHFVLPPFLSREPSTSTTSSSSKIISTSATVPSIPAAAVVPRLESSLSFNAFVPHVYAPLPQSDLARLTNTLRAVIEVNQHPWRGDDDELSTGVRQGLEQVAAHTQRHSEISELRVGGNLLDYNPSNSNIGSQTRTMFDSTLESLKVCFVLCSSCSVTN